MNDRLFPATIDEALAMEIGAVEEFTARNQMEWFETNPRYRQFILNNHSPKGERGEL